MKRGPYQLDLKQQVKIRIDYTRLKRLDQMSEELGITKSQLIRNLLDKLVDDKI